MGGMPSPLTPLPKGEGNGWLVKRMFDQSDHLGEIRLNVAAADAEHAQAELFQNALSLRIGLRLRCVDGPVNLHY